MGGCRLSKLPRSKAATRLCSGNCFVQLINHTQRTQTILQTWKTRHYYFFHLNKLYRGRATLFSWGECEKSSSKVVCNQSVLSEQSTWPPPPPNCITTTKHTIHYNAPYREWQIKHARLVTYRIVEMMKSLTLSIIAESHTVSNHWHLLEAN